MLAEWGTMDRVQEQLIRAQDAIQDAMIASKGVGGSEAAVMASKILGRITELALHFIRAQSHKERGAQ